MDAFAACCYWVLIWLCFVIGYVVAEDNGLIIGSAVYLFALIVVAISSEGRS